MLDRNFANPKIFTWRPPVSPHRSIPDMLCSSQFSVLLRSRSRAGLWGRSVYWGRVLIECRRAVNVHYYSGRVETRLECRTSIMFTPDQRITPANSNRSDEHFSQKYSPYHKNKNRLQFLFVVKAAVLNSKYHTFMRKFNAQKLAITFIEFSQRPVMNVKENRTLQNVRYAGRK